MEKGHIYNYSTQERINLSTITTQGGIEIKKHMTVLSHITFGYNPVKLIELCHELGVIPLDSLVPELTYNLVCHQRYCNLHNVRLRQATRLQSIAAQHRCTRQHCDEY